MSTGSGRPAADPDCGADAPNHGTPFRIAWDTNCLIYFLEGAGAAAASDAARRRHQYLRRQMESFEAGERECVLSTLVVAEMAAGLDDPQRLRHVAERLGSLRGLRWVDVTVDVALEAGRVRRRCGLTLADAIHLASAHTAGAQAFLTNDRRLGAASSYLPVLVLDDVI
ncbi:MAG TPA: type II toxin-antitoxin system VapC family toxin [Bacillota bacterium]